MVSSAQFSIFNSDGDTPKLREQLCDDNRYVVWISGVFANGQSIKLFGIFMMLVLLLCVMYFFCSQKPYEADLITVTPKIKIPAPSGQAQHGSASFMTEEQKRRKFNGLVLSSSSPEVKKLLDEGERRAAAVDGGQTYTPNKLNIENLFDEAGIVVGKRNSAGKEYITCLTDDVHTLTIGATGGGKSRREVLQTICMLALAGEGIVVSDPKGELYHYTHTFLESVGYTVHVVDFNQPYRSDRYNPLQRIIDDVLNDDLTSASEHAWDIVNILVEKNEKSEPIWSNGEMAVIVASILAVVYDNRDDPQYQNLTNVYEFISNMSKPSPGEKEIRYTKYLRTLPDNHPARQTMAIAQVAPDKMGASFYTQALTTLRLFANPNTYRITSASDFNAFFLDESEIGAFAEDKLCDLVKAIHSIFNETSIYSIKEEEKLIRQIQLIGDPYIRRKFEKEYQYCKDKYGSDHPDKKSLNEEIAEKEKELAGLKRKLYELGGE